MVIIYSGGLDSTVLLHQYQKDIKLAITFDYDSKHNNKEIECAKKNIKKLGIKHIIIKLPFINENFKSNLLKSGGDIPNGEYDSENMKSTVVPFRNGIMLSIAAGIADSIGAKKVLIANHAGDHHIYPDCRPVFIGEMNSAIAYGTENQINILAPYTFITKREIALIGQKLDVNFKDTWSCYKGENIHCGICSTCLERKKSLEGFDVTTYKIN